MPNDDFGILTFRTYTAGGALPVPGAVIRVRSAESGTGGFKRSLVTDRDGRTEPLILPAPKRDLSLAPSPAQTPYSTYDIEISAPGYYPKRINGLTVFSGVNAIQLINMIPETSEPNENYPKGNIDADIPENTRL